MIHTVQKQNCRGLCFVSITPDLLAEAREKLDFKLNVCRIIKGAHIEHFKKSS